MRPRSPFRRPARRRPLRSLGAALVLVVPLIAGSAALATARSAGGTATYLEGIDVSSYQGTIDWAKVAGAGKRFAIVRASGGSLDIDATYAANRTGARAAGLAVGAYHFANPDSVSGDALREAAWFLRYATPARGDLVPALDLERNMDLTTGGLQRWVRTWLGAVEASTGVKPMIYTTPSFWQQQMGDTRAFADAGYTVLWIAHWGVTSPTVPGAGWGGNGWTFWQYSSRGSVPGIAGKVDLDRYRGSALPASLFIP